MIFADLDAANAAALAGGSVLRARFGQVQHVRYKGAIDLVTDADEMAESAVVSEILRRFPNDRILAEEGTTGGNDPSRLWIIDPLDGTTNFAHGYPMFGVSVALEIVGVVEVSVVYEPILDELFSAVRGNGAWLNYQPIHVSATRDLKASLLCTGFPYEQEEQGAAVDLLKKAVLRAQGVRRDGAAAIDLCYVAMGRFDGYWERSVHAWDVAAGELIVTEAGGKVSGFKGELPDIRSGEAVATNGLIHEELLRIINRLL